MAWGNSGGRAPEKRLARHQEQIRRLKIKWTAASGAELKAREANNEADEWRFHCEASNLAAKITELENLCKKHERLVEEKKEKHLLQHQELESEGEIETLRKFQFESTKKSISQGNKAVIASVNQLWLQWDRAWADIGPNLPPPPVPRPENVHSLGNQNPCTDSYDQAQKTTKKSLRDRLGVNPLRYIHCQGAKGSLPAKLSAAQAAPTLTSTSEEEVQQDPEETFIHFDIE